MLTKETVQKHVKTSSSKIRAFGRFLKKHWKIFASFSAYVLLIYLCFLAVEFGSVTEIRGIVPVSMNIQEIFLNLVIISFLWSVIHLIIGNIYISSIVTMLFFAVLGIVNHYVIMLHGMPLTFQEIQNFGTVMNIIGGIKISSDIAVFKIAAVFFITLFVFSTLFFLKMDKGATWFNTLWKRLIFVILNFAFVDLTLISPAAIKPDSILAWSWREVYPVYGYGLCSLESYQNLFNIVKEPEGYDVADIPRVDLSTWYSDERPDVILILNETFYDFNKITDLETDTEYMPYISKMENLKKGYTVVPNFGGGTNATEYELLTGNSNKLINNVSPFNVIDMKDSLSIVSVMNDIGYETTAMHSEPGSNYSRYRGYEELGFENIYFAEEFTDLEYYGNRNYATDESLYKNLIRRYETAVSQQEKDNYKPEFMYLLTIQNHGSWNQNPESEDIIHSLKDYGGANSEMNEYLSCMQLSDQAFYNLTEYFKTVDRPVVICMLGDHCPSFAYDIRDKEMSEADREINLRSTPFIMWSNRDWAQEYELETFSTNFVVPYILRAMDLPRPPYYQYMTKLSEDYPVIGADMKYVDKAGTIHTYDDAPEEVTGYFYMEYNNIGDKGGRVEDLFGVVR